MKKTHFECWFSDVFNDLSLTWCKFCGEVGCPLRTWSLRNQIPKSQPLPQPFSCRLRHWHFVVALYFQILLWSSQIMRAWSPSHTGVLYLVFKSFWSIFMFFQCNTFWHFFLFPLVKNRNQILPSRWRFFSWLPIPFSRPTALRLSELHGDVPFNTPGGLGDEARLSSTTRWQENCSFHFGKLSKSRLMIMIYLWCSIIVLISTLGPQNHEKMKVLYPPNMACNLEEWRLWVPMV